MALTHSVTATGTNDGTKQVSKDAWNADHVISTDGLTIPVNTGTPTAPAADNVTIFGREIANRALPAFVGPSGLDSALQPLLGRNKVGWWAGIAGATTNTGTGLALTATGTATAATWGTANLPTSMNRLSFRVTTASATAVAGYRGGALNYWRGNAAGLGGFTYIVRWAPGTHTTAPVSTAQRAFHGLRSSTTAPTDVEPSTLTNAIGMGYGAADTTLQIYAAGTSMSVINTGISVTKTPVSTTVSANQVFELAMFCKPNDSQVVIAVTELVSGSTYSTTVTTSTNLPSSTTGLNVYGWLSAGGTSSVISLDVMSIYIESDN